MIAIYEIPRESSGEMRGPTGISDLEKEQERKRTEFAGRPEIVKGAVTTRPDLTRRLY